jgi:hypothetical protein
MRIKLAVVALALLGALLLGAIVWLVADDGGSDRRAAEIGATEEPRDEALTEGVRGSIRWRGPFDCAMLKETPYEPLDIVSYEGSTYIAKVQVAECVEPPEEPWDLFAMGGENGAAGAQGPQGPAGTFTGTFQSPDGNYRLTVSNAGIRAEGPTGRWYLDSGGYTVDGFTAVSVRAGATLNLSASSGATLRGTTVTLGCTSGAKPVARKDDPIQVMNSPGTTGNLVLNGSPNVLAC